MGDSGEKDSPPPKVDKKTTESRQKMGERGAKTHVPPRIPGQIDKKMGDRKIKGRIPPIVTY